MSEPNTALKKYPQIAACGLDCGLCPRYYTAGPSRCPGCGGPDFTSKHPSCSFITCCVKKKNLEVCGECPDFPCVKFKSAEEYDNLKDSSSYPSYKKVLPNLWFIKEHGIVRFIEEQITNNAIILLIKQIVVLLIQYSCLNLSNYFKRIIMISSICS